MVRWCVYFLGGGQDLDFDAAAVDAHWEVTGSGVTFRESLMLLTVVEMLSNWAACASNLSEIADTSGKLALMSSTVVCSALTLSSNSLMSCLIKTRMF
jgi:hypothetical protein